VNGKSDGQRRQLLGKGNARTSEKTGLLCNWEIVVKRTLVWGVGVRSLLGGEKSLCQSGSASGWGTNG